MADSLDFPTREQWHDYLFRSLSNPPAAPIKYELDAGFGKPCTNEDCLHAKKYHEKQPGRAYRPCTVFGCECVNYERFLT